MSNSRPESHLSKGGQPHHRAYLRNNELIIEPIDRTSTNQGSNRENVSVNVSRVHSKSNVDGFEDNLHRASSTGRPNTLRESVFTTHTSAHDTVHVELERVHTRGIVEDFIDPKEEGISPTRDFQTFLGHYTATHTLPLYGLRKYFSEYVAEFFGTMVLITFGNGVNATTTFNTTNLQSGYLTVTIGWGLALTCALYVSLGVSGGHLNPAVSFALALFGRFPYRKLVGYWLAQILGAIVGAANVFGLFHAQFNAYDGGNRQITGPQGTGGIFFTLPQADNSRAQSVFSEILNTALLMAVILGVNDPRMTPAEGYKPIAVGLIVITIGMCTGFVSGYAINPARDFGPRALTAMAGWGKYPFTIYSHYFVIPLFCPFAGAVLGFAFYEFFIVPPEKDNVTVTQTIEGEDGGIEGIDQAGEEEKV
ncbi:aquaporin-like protein [Mycoemilia scoparia]|uniref:Aquaporin-like protein n=1 Tax=Mycoemilia scoparia TaxID=417184 RepID=A0A9W8A210_9FUNG|nr:aquaporin-like protein [Mycoemilia scoparia]